MIKRYSKVRIIATLSGTCVGIVLAVPCVPNSGMYHLSIPLLWKLWMIIQTVPMLLSFVWAQLFNLPPHGENSMWMMAGLMSVMFWTLVGFLVGLWRCRKLQRKAAVNSDKAAEK
jgi:hypothetical protein